MRRAVYIQDDVRQVQMVEDLTEVFEGIASMRISRLRDRVVASKQFFAELWQVYSSLRVDPHKRLRQGREHLNRDALIAVTAEGKLSGNLDEQIIATLLQARDPATSDILVIGTHGLVQLQQAGLQPVRAFHLPPNDDAFNVSNVIEALAPYRRISVFYQTYESLRVQKTAFIELVAAVRSLGEDVADRHADGTPVEVVSPGDYIFEPDLNEIADYMESVMMGVALIQIVMESKLAQYASRFNAMTAAKQRAGELLGSLERQFYRAKRTEGDERLKEMMKVLQYRGHP